MIKWNEYTWYSKWASLVFFILVLPILTFYIGTLYQESKDISEAINPQDVLVKRSQVTSSPTNVYKDDLIQFEYPSDYSIKDTSLSSVNERIEISRGSVTFAISDVATGFGDDWISYSASENVNGYNVDYLQSGQNFRIVAGKKNYPYYVVAILSNEEDAKNPKIKAIFQNILLSLKKI